MYGILVGDGQAIALHASSVVGGVVGGVVEQRVAIRIWQAFASATARADVHYAWPMPPTASPPMLTREGQRLTTVVMTRGEAIRAIGDVGLAGCGPAFASAEQVVVAAIGAVAPAEEIAIAVTYDQPMTVDNGVARVVIPAAVRTTGTPTPACMTVDDGTGPTRVVALGDGGFLGRRGDCRVQIHQPLVNARHARIWVERGRYLIEDQSSYLPTLVNDRPIPGQLALAHGDVITVPEARLTFVAPGRVTPIGAAPSPGRFELELAITSRPSTMYWSPTHTFTTAYVAAEDATRLSLVIAEATLGHAIVIAGRTFDPTPPAPIEIVVG